MPPRYFPAIVERAADGGFGVFFPDLPGCTSGGDTVQEAARNAEEALQAHLELLAEGGDLLPDPSDLDATPRDPGVAEAVRLLVRAEPPGRAVRVNVTLPEDVLAAVDRHASRRGQTRSGFLAYAAREQMRRDRDAS
jgi:predicted RNase H-like HicB family nuclease